MIIIFSRFSRIGPGQGIIVVVVGAGGRVGMKTRPNKNA